MRLPTARPIFLRHVARSGLRAVALVLFAVAGFWACHDAMNRPAPPPIRPEPAAWRQGALHVAWLGHASVLLRIGGATILTDPAFFDRIGVSLGPLTIGPERLVASALGPDELPPLDAVVLSHAHMDSLDRPSLAAIGAPVLVTPERTRDLVDDLGYGRVVELGWGERTSAGGVTIEAVAVAHWGRRWPWERWRGYNGYLFTHGNEAILFASDTAYTPTFADLGRRQPITAAILGNGAYDPWVWNHATPEQVWRMFRESRAEWLVPIHWDTFALGKEPPGDAMQRLVAAAGNAADRIAIRRIGETWTLPARSPRTTRASRGLP